MGSDKSFNGGLVAVLLIVVAAVSYWIGGVSTNTSPSTLKHSTVQVTKYYDGQEGYSLSIQTGNTSTCIWTNVNGNAAIPYLETTTARSSTEKHTIYTNGAWDWTVICSDDFGNQYSGVFPE